MKMNLEWYSTLNKSPLTPPSWVFAPVWTVLYIMMGVSFYLVIKDGNYSAKLPQIGLFMTQLFFNLIWSRLFFGYHLISIALIDIILLDITLILTIIMFWKVSHVAAMLLVPYMLWLVLATYLNFEIYRLN